jgi:hypothetical protein
MTSRLLDLIQYQLTFFRLLTSLQQHQQQQEECVQVRVDGFVIGVVDPFR